MLRLVRASTDSNRKMRWLFIEADTAAKLALNLVRTSALNVGLKPGGLMVSKSRTVAQQLLRLSAVTWLTVKGFHNIKTFAPVPFHVCLSRLSSTVPRLLLLVPPRRSLNSLSEARSLRMSDLKL